MIQEFNLYQVIGCTRRKPLLNLCLISLVVGGFALRLVRGIAYNVLAVGAVRIINDKLN